MNDHDPKRPSAKQQSADAAPAARHVPMATDAAPAARHVPMATDAAPAARHAQSSPVLPPTSSPPPPHRRPALRLRLVVMPQRPRQRGFSLLELLVVVAILGILIAAALPRFAEYRAAAYDSRSQQDLRNLAAAEELYRASSPAYADDAALLKGFAASEGVEIELESANATGFIATATHPAGSRTFRWDSSADPPLTSSAN